MQNGKLTGYAIRMAMLPADHTYVTSSAGHVWPCFGRGAGGAEVCAGSANVHRAHCLSKPRSEAGIVYAVTGVCHQAANRILYPAGKTVSGARGYRWSLFTYGAYGKDPDTNDLHFPSRNPWPELAACIGFNNPKNRSIL